MDLLITYQLIDGEERTEHWPSIERFRSWAMVQGLACTWSAYQHDDEEWVLLDRGRIGAMRP